MSLLQFVYLSRMLSGIVYPPASVLHLSALHRTQPNLHITRVLKFVFFPNVHLLCTCIVSGRFRVF